MIPGDPRGKVSEGDYHLLVDADDAQNDVSHGDGKILAPLRPRNVSISSSMGASSDDRRLAALEREYSRLQDSSTQLLAPPTRPRGFGTRHGIILMCSLATFVMYLARVAISIALVGAHGISAQRGLTTADEGFINSAFFIGYGAAMVPSGELIARWGPVRTLGLSGAVQVVATLLTPAAAARSAAGAVGGLCALRAALGLAQAPLYPATAQMISAWLPAGERSRGYTITDGGSYLATALTLGVGPMLIDAVGYAGLFYLYAGVVGAWGLAWAHYCTSRPERHPRVGTAELAWLLDATSTHELTTSTSTTSTDTEQGRAGRRRGATPWRALFGSSAMWAAITVGFSTCYLLYTFQTFSPEWMAQELGLDLGAKGNALYMLTPWILLGLCGVGGGLLVDRAIARGGGTTRATTRARKVAATVGAVLPSACCVGLAFIHTTHAAQGAALALMTGAVACYGFGTSGGSVNPIDLAPRHASVTKAVANTAGQLAGAVAPTIAGLFLHAGGCPASAAAKKHWAPTAACERAWRRVFLTTAGVAMTGLCVFLIWGTSEPVIGGPKGEKDDGDGGGGGDGNGGGGDPAAGAGSRQRWLDEQVLGEGQALRSPVRRERSSF